MSACLLPTSPSYLASCRALSTAIFDSCHVPYPLLRYKDSQTGTNAMKTAISTLMFALATAGPALAYAESAALAPSTEALPQKVAGVNVRNNSAFPILVSRPGQSQQELAAKGTLQLKDESLSKPLSITPKANGADPQGAFRYVTLVRGGAGCQADVCLVVQGATQTSTAAPTPPESRPELEILNTSDQPLYLLKSGKTVGTIDAKATYRADDEFLKHPAILSWRERAAPDTAMPHVSVRGFGSTCEADVCLVVK